MISKRKIWATAVIAAHAGSLHAADASASDAAAGANDFPGGSFASALDKVLAGEGGEGGAGMSRLKRMVMIPALNGAQIEKALQGNTLRRDESFAFAFENGTFSGWEYEWQEVEVKRCETAAKTDVTYELDEGVCWSRSDNRVSKGTWSVEQDMLCTQPALKMVTDGQRCVSLALVLDNLAVFGPDGGMIGKGADLVRGKQLDEIRKRD
jgi:hypothetical protein